MAHHESHRHHLSSILNLIASLQEPAEDQPGSGLNHGEFKDNFGSLILSSLPEQQSNVLPSSAFLHASSALSPDTGQGGIFPEAELPVALDDVQRKIILYHLANLELLDPQNPDSPELQHRHWDNLLSNNHRLIPADAYTYQSITNPEQMHTKSTALSETARLHGPAILRDIAKVCRSFHPDLYVQRQAPANPLIFHCRDHITSSRETHPVTLIPERVSNLHIPPCNFPEELQRPLMLRLKNLILLLLISSSMASISQAVLLLRAATLVANARSTQAVQALQLFGPSARLANLNDEVTLANSPISDEYRGLIKSHTAQLTALKRAVINAIAEQRQLLLNKDACASLTLHKKLCGSANHINFSTLLGSLLSVPRSDPDMVAIMNTLQEFANTGFNSPGTDATAPIIQPLVREAEERFAGYWGDTSGTPGAVIASGGVGLNASSFAFNLLQKALGEEVARASKLAQEGVVEVAANDTALSNLLSLRESIDSNIKNLDAHLMSRNSENCPVSLEYSNTRSSYQASIREQILNTISRLTLARDSANAARSNRDNIFAHTAPRWQSMKFSGFRKDWMPFKREFTGLFRDFEDDDIYVKRMLVNSIDDRDLQDLVREKDTLADAMGFLERRFSNADDEVTRILEKFDSFAKPVNRHQELAVYLKLQALKKRLLQAGGEGLMSRFATRKIAERVMSYKVWERFNKNQAHLKRKKREAFMEENGDLSRDQVITIQNNNERGLNLTHKEAFDIFWSTIEDAILYIENMGLVAHINDRIFVPDSGQGATGANGHTGDNAGRGRGGRRRGAFNNLASSQGQSNTDTTTWGGAADAAARANGSQSTAAPFSGGGAGRAGKAQRTLPTCRLKCCRDKGGQNAQHTLFQCPIIQGIAPSPAPISKLLTDSGICSKCARFASECGRDCDGSYLLRNGTSRSGLCQEGCKNINRMFCMHSKIYNSKLNKFKGASQNLATLHTTAGDVINDLLDNQECDRADIEELAPAPSSAHLYTLSAAVEPISQAFDVLCTSPLNEDPFRNNSQLTDIIKVCSNVPGALVFLTRVLFDTGADVSYVCTNFAKQLDLEPVPLPKAFDLPTAGGGYSLVTHHYVLKIVRDHDEDILIKVHGIDDLTRKYSAMHLSVPQEVLKQFSVQPAHFSQASYPISLILGADVWRHLAPVELKRTDEYLLYRSVITNNLLLAGARRSAPQNTVSQYTLLALNNLHTEDIFHKAHVVKPRGSAEDIFHKNNNIDTNIAKLHHILSQAAAPDSLITNKEYLDIREKQLHGEAEDLSTPRERLRIPFRPLQEEHSDRSRSPHKLTQPAGVRRSRDLHPAVNSPKPRYRRKTVTFNAKVELYTPLNNLVWVPIEDSKYTLGMVAFHQNSPMRHSGSLYSMEIRGDMWAHDNSAPVKSFFDKYGVNFNIPFQPIRDCEKCSKLCEECKILSSKLDPSSLLEYTLFYKQTVWSEQHKKWFCDPVFDHRKLRMLGNGSRQVMTRMVKLDEKVAKLGEQDRDSLNDCVTKAIEGGALKVAADLPELEGLQKAYIPMGYVCSQSASTPVRAVWDNAFRVDQQSVSLNDCQLTGPNLCSLFRCAAYIRSFRYFSSLDIKKSFWNLHVGPLSMSLHRVFMKVAMIDGVIHSRLGHKEGEFTEYVMSTLSFGDKAATAHLAVAIAKGLVKFGVDEQLARHLLLFVYVDNAHLASNDLQQLKDWELQTDKFFADMNWATHSWIRSYEVEPPVTLDHAQPENSVVKLLGVFHDVKTDRLSVTFSINLGKVSRNKKLSPDLDSSQDPLQYILLHGLTRRTALRVSGSIFCYSGHCITLQVASRLCFRQAILWNPQSSWDQQLTLQTKKLYAELFKNILDCSGHSWPRCWLPKDQGMEEDGIHPYLAAHCDGSLVASSTKIFLISKPLGSKMRQASLICARAQVAPVKQVLTVPQLELNSLWLAAKAIEEIKQNFEVRIYGAVVLTDSETSFHWTQASPNFLQKFAANKVKVIQSILDVKKIFHIASRFNMADASSKYQATISKQTLAAEVEPGFMVKHRSEWPMVRLNPSSRDLPDVLDKYRGMGVDIFSQPELAVMPQTTCQAGDNAKQVVQAFNLEPRLRCMQRSSGVSFFDRSVSQEQYYQNPQEAMEDYQLIFGPDYGCDVVMPVDERERFITTESLDFHEPDHSLNTLLRKGYKPLVHSFLARKAKDRGEGWLKHPWSQEVPQILESMKHEDPEHFADLMLAHTSLDKVIRILALCVRFGRRCRKAEGRDESAPLQKHFITVHMMLHRAATPKVKCHLATQVLSERFFEKDGILRVFNRRFKNRDTEFAETSIVLSARTAIGILTLLDFHYKKGGHLCSALSITSKLRAGTPSLYAPFATKLLQSIESHCVFCRMKKMLTARPVQGMVAVGQSATRTIFKHVVLDGAGPWYAVRGEGAKEEKHKIWSYIWTCMSTGLVHITVAENLSAAQVLLGLAEITATYGKVSTVHCDGQSAFQLVARKHSEARDAVAEEEREDAAITTLQMEALRRHGVKEGITFKFGAPRAAHYQAAAELVVGAVKKILYMENVADIVPEIKEIFQKGDMTEKQFELVETIQDSSGLSMLQFQALWRRIATKLNQRPWHYSEAGVFSRWDLLHPRDNDEGTEDEVTEPVLLDKTDKAYEQLQIVEAALQVVWERYTGYLLSHLAKGEQARWPSLDANDFKPGTLILFRDRVLKQGRLDLGIVQEEVKPTPGDAQRRYLVRSAHRKHKSDHPRPIAADTVAHSILERDASSLIRLGHSQDNGPVFFDPAVLRDDPTPEPEPVYPGQSGGSAAPSAPPLVYSKDKTGASSRFGKKHLRTVAPRVAGRAGSADLRSPEERESKLLPLYTVRQDAPVIQGQEVPTTGQPVDQLEEPGAVQQDELYAVQQDEEEASSLLPRDMAPPPQLEDVLTAIPTPGEGLRLFSAVACAMLIQREGENPQKIPAQRRKSITTFIRKQAMQLGISLTYKPEAEQIFGFLLQAGQAPGEMLEELRQIFESFVDKPKQQAVPGKFGQQFGQLVVIFPQLLSMAIGSALYIYTEGARSNLERIEGFKALLGREHTHPAVVIKFDGLSYSTMIVTKGYEQIFVKIQERLAPEDSFVPQDLIEKVLQIVHYLSHQEETREYV